MKIWLAFLQNLNGVSLRMPIKDASYIKNQFHSDASRGGCTAIFHIQWFQVAWTEPWNQASIALKEFLPIVLALHLWAKEWRQTRLLFMCNNEAVVEDINRNTAKDPGMLALSHHLMLVSLRLDLFVHACHLPGKVTTIADHLSRIQATREFLNSQGLSTDPVLIPSTLKAALLL